jgi:hypothetical protein
MGVTSLVRALGLKQGCYERMLGLFHSSGLDVGMLTRLWVAVVLKLLRHCMVKINGRIALAGALSTIFAVPLAARIHEGVLFNNNDKRAPQML